MLNLLDHTVNQMNFIRTIIIKLRGLILANYITMDIWLYNKICTYSDPSLVQTPPDLGIVRVSTNDEVRVIYYMESC